MRCVSAPGNATREYQQAIPAGATLFCAFTRLGATATSTDAHDRAAKAR
jgi:hypothetical protein